MIRDMLKKQKTIPKMARAHACKERTTVKRQSVLGDFNVI